MDKTEYQKYLKSLYFTGQKDVKKTSHYGSFKTTNRILKNISSKGKFQKIKHRSLVHLILKKILLKNQLEWISYAYIKNDVLIIFAKNHIAQSELNYQKSFLLQCFTQIESFSKLTKVSILRDTKKNEIIKNKLKPKFNEQSFGIFDNCVTNQRLFKIIENIRLHIMKLN